MNVQFNENDGVLMAGVEGEITISTSPDLKKQFEKYKTPNVVINLSRVDYVDSSGLATLVEILKRSKTSGGSLHLTGLTDKVKSLFEITKLDKLFKIHSDDETALQQLKS